jgi:hypothetical protein
MAVLRSPFIERWEPAEDFDGLEAGARAATI